MRLLAAVLLALLLSPSAFAQTAGVPPSSEQPSIYDRIWRFADVYRDDSNPVIQRVLFTGRLQEDYAAIDAEQGELGDWNLRRLRLGPRVTLFKKFMFHAEVELDPQGSEPTYVRMTDLYLMWTRNPGMALTVGKQSVPFTADGATSSKELLTIDRSNLANNIWFPQEYMPGVSASGRRGPWQYRTGIYSSGDANREFGEFNGGFFTLGTLAYDFSEPLEAKEALLTGSYVYQKEDANNTFTRSLDHVVSLNLRYEDARWGLRSDLSLASGYLGQSDLWGFMAMPFVNLARNLQAAGRYTFLNSENPNGVRLATYESRVVEGRGDRYNEVYGGANYYFYGHKLKVQTGLQWADMKDSAGDGGQYSGFSWTTGFRTSW